MHLARIAADLSPDAEIDESQNLTRSDLRIDLRDLISTLPDDYQDVCLRLMADESLAEVADTPGMWLGRIRATFVEARFEL